MLFAVVYDKLFVTVLRSKFPLKSRNLIYSNSIIPQKSKIKFVKLSENKVNRHTVCTCCSFCGSNICHLFL